MRLAIGLALILLGIVFAIYVGLWLMFIGGIIQIVETCSSGMWDSNEIAFGILRICLAGFSAWVAGMCLIVPGAVMLKDA